MKRAAFACVVIAASSAQAHDFWLQPTHWHEPDGMAVELTLEVGHGADRQRSPIRASRINIVEAIQADGSIVDLHSGLHLGDNAGDLTADGLRGPPGLIALATDVTAESHLDPDRFNSHLRDEGLTEAIAWRGTHGMTDREGSENYGRVAKVLFPSAAQTKAMLRPLGLELEIVPLADPYSPGLQQLPVEILFKGSPLHGATVKLFDLADDKAPKASCISDIGGKCAFGFARKGSWLVNVVWSTPNPVGSDTDFRTIFSSLSFGFDGLR